MSEQSPMNVELKDDMGLVVRINAPDFFKRDDFISYLESATVFTWHTAGSTPDEYSDVMVLVEPSLNGEGTDADMPGDIWDLIIDTLKEGFGDNGESLPPQFKNRHIAVWITNLD